MPDSNHFTILMGAAGARAVARIRELLWRRPPGSATTPSQKSSMEFTTSMKRSRLTGLRM